MMAATRSSSGVNLTHNVVTEGTTDQRQRRRTVQRAGRSLSPTARSPAMWLAARCALNYGAAARRRSLRPRRQSRDQR